MSVLLGLDMWGIQVFLGKANEASQLGLRCRLFLVEVLSVHLRRLTLDGKRKRHLVCATKELSLSNAIRKQRFCGNFNAAEASYSKQSAA